MGRFVGAATLRQRLMGGFLTLVVLVLGIVGVDSWLQRRAMSWNLLPIWMLVKISLYDGPPMVKLPGGRFEMGASDCNPGSSNYECPQHSVTIQPFEIGKYEVTFAEYSVFVLDSVGFEVPSDQNWERDSRPVINVSWDDAKAYAEWLSRVTGKRYRLPTEAEWEYAARAGTATNYWWGDDVNQGGKVWANCSDCGSEWGGKKTAPTGSFPANGFGLHDMQGNVTECTEDDWHENYEGAPDDGRAWTDYPRGSRRVVRGGSWGDDAQYCRSAFRDYGPPRLRNSYLGFRLSRSVALGP